MHYFEKKIKIFSPEGPHENVWGPLENVSPGPAVDALVQSGDDKARSAGNGRMLQRATAAVTVSLSLAIPSMIHRLNQLESQSTA